MTVEVSRRSDIRIVRWRRMAFGLALSGAAGIVLGKAWTSQDGSWWWLGTTTLLSAGLMVLSAVYVRADPKIELIATETARTAQQQRIEDRWEIEPMLGEILVQHGAITSDELLLALGRQEGTGLLLGEVLIDMHLVSLEQLEEALGEQSAWRDAQRFRRAEETQRFQIMVGQDDPHPVS